MKTLTKEQLGTVDMQCLCGWTGKASGGELREGCDVAFSEEKLTECCEQIKELERIVAAMTMEEQKAFATRNMQWWNSLHESSKDIFVQCPRCGMTAAVTGSDFEPVRVVSEEVPA